MLRICHYCLYVKGDWEEDGIYSDKRILNNKDLIADRAFSSYHGGTRRVGSGHHVMATLYMGIDIAEKVRERC